MSIREVNKFPPCSFCMEARIKKLAHYDGETKGGQTAKMCHQHFDEHGIGLGLERGQKLVLWIEKQCPILPSHHVRKGGLCTRFATCQIQGYTIDPRCQARGQVLR